MLFYLVVVLVLMTRCMQLCVGVCESDAVFTTCIARFLLSPLCVSLCLCVCVHTQLNESFDPEDAHHVVRLTDYFIHKKHLCLVFELVC